MFYYRHVNFDTFRVNYSNCLSSNCWLLSKWDISWHWCTKRSIRGTVFGVEAVFTRMKENSCFSEFFSEISKCECILVLVWKPEQTGPRGKPRFDRNMLVILKWILKEYNATLKSKSEMGPAADRSGTYGFLKIRSSWSAA